MAVIRLSRAKWILVLLTALIESLVGMALSISSIWVDREKLLLITTDETSLFYSYFSILSLAINIIVFMTSCALMTIQITDFILKRDREQRRRLLYQAQERRVYGAFGYYSMN